MGGLAVPIVLGGIELYSQHKQAKKQKKLGKEQQRINEEAAVKEIAAGQRSAREQEHIAQMVASRAVAVAAASGAGATDSTVLNIVSDIEGEGAYRAAVEVYQSKQRAKQLKETGKIAYETGKSRAEASYLDAVTTIMGTAYQYKYGGMRNA